MKKYLKIFILILFILIILTNKSFATDTIDYKGISVNLELFNQVSTILLYDNYNSRFVSYYLYGTGHNACVGNTQYFVVEENDEYIYIGGRCTGHKDFETFYVCPYDAINGVHIDSEAIIGTTLNKYGGYYKISKKQYSFVYKEAEVYTNGNYDELYTGSFFSNKPDDFVNNNNAPEMINTGYQRNLLAYLKPLHTFYIFSISDNYTGSLDFYIQGEENRGLTVYNIQSIRSYNSVSNSWTVIKDIGHTRYDDFDIEFFSDKYGYCSLKDFYIVSCSTGYSAKQYSGGSYIDVTLPLYSSFTETFYCIPEKEYVTLDNFSFSQVVSIEYSNEFYNSYNAYLSLDGINWTTMQKEICDDSKENSPFIFYQDVFENGMYQVRIFDDSTGLYVYEDTVKVDNIPFEINLEPSEDTDKPIVVKSNIFSFNTSLKYSVAFSTDKIDWTNLNRSQVEPNEENPPDSGDTYYWTRIFKNGTYYFRFTYFNEVYEGDTLVSATPVHFYVTKEIKNILVEDYMSDDYIFKPIISLDFNEEKQSFIVRTQSILLDKALNLNCFYISYEKTEGFNPNEQIPEDTITGWNKMEIDFENNIYMNTSDAYFYFEIPVINAEDTSYKIAFYNYISEKSSGITYYDFVYEEVKNYVENDLDVHLGINIYLNDLLRSFESRLGILGFPINLVRQFSNKILTLQVKEPIIHISELHDPFYHNKIFNGVDYNFNTLLVNKNVVFIHDFYLIVVDMILIFIFLHFCVKTVKSFIDFDK